MAAWTGVREPARELSVQIQQEIGEASETLDLDLLLSETGLKASTLSAQDDRSRALKAVEQLCQMESWSPLLAFLDRLEHLRPQLAPQIAGWRAHLVPRVPLRRVVASLRTVPDGVAVRLFAEKNMAARWPLSPETVRVWPPEGEGDATDGDTPSGEALTGLLFGTPTEWRPWLVELLDVASSDACLTQQGLALRIETDAPDLLELPWRGMAWAGSSLEVAGWQISLALSSWPQSERVREPEGTTLLVGGDREDPELFVEAHLTSMQERLEDRGHRVRRVYDPASLDDVGPFGRIYVFGRGRAGPEPSLVMGSGKVLALADLATRLGARATPPGYVHLNLVWSEGLPVPALGPTFAGCAPFVVLNPAPLAPSAARSFARSFMLGEGEGDGPQAVFRSAALATEPYDAVSPQLWARAAGFVAAAPAAEEAETSAPPAPARPVPTTADLFAGVLELDRDAQWTGTLRACARPHHALVTVHGHLAQSVPLFLERAKRVLSSTGQHNPHPYDVVTLSTRSADHVWPESAALWLTRFTDELGVHGTPEQALAERLETTPILAILGPVPVETLSPRAWTALETFATERLPATCPAAAEGGVVRLLLALSFKSEEGEARTRGLRAWRRRLDASTAGRPWVFMPLPALDYPDWDRHVDPYIRERTIDLEPQRQDDLLARGKRLYTLLTEAQAMTFAEFSAALDGAIGETFL